MNQDCAQDVWTKISSKLEALRALDSETQYVLGAFGHRYQAQPCVDLSVIEAYEQRFNVSLPKAYRSFLRYFGAGGVGPEGGIFRFPEDIWQADPSMPLLLSQFSIISEVDENNSLKSFDGMIRIGDCGNPTSLYLVVTGEIAGNIIWYNGDHAGFLGTFDGCYERWIDESIRLIRVIEPLTAIKAGMSLVDISSIVGREYSLYQNNTILRFKNTPGWIKLNSKGSVVEVMLNKGCINPALEI